MFAPIIKALYSLNYSVHVLSLTTLKTKGGVPFFRVIFDLRAFDDR
jgi:hypothetical protein